MVTTKKRRIEYTHKEVRKGLKTPQKTRKTTEKPAKHERRQ